MTKSLIFCVLVLSNKKEIHMLITSMITWQWMFMNVKLKVLKEINASNVGSTKTDVVDFVGHV